MVGEKVCGIMHQNQLEIRMPDLGSLPCMSRMGLRKRGAAGDNRRCGQGCGHGGLIGLVIEGLDHGLPLFDLGGMLSFPYFSPLGQARVTRQLSEACLVSRRTPQGLFQSPWLPFPCQ